MDDIQDVKEIQQRRCNSCGKIECRCIDYEKPDNEKTNCKAIS